jgi:hypothetical protein
VLVLVEQVDLLVVRVADRSKMVLKVKIGRKKLMWLVFLVHDDDDDCDDCDA